ncbi:futalosine hydrolase [Arcticibacter sp. MXS-1]|uniref:futalosine hydrolase n=1 Tax=Arcticibacter sp. MXS-1 TaxID=3341726 RepID=UPI0035A8DF2C
MKLLIVSATPAEIEPLTRFLAEREDLQEGVNVVISGVGMVATAFSMGTELALARYDLAVNAGIAGAFDKSLPLGTVLQVKEDCFSELGAEDDTAFITLDDLGFGKSTERPLAFGLSEGRLSSLPEVSAITVNRVHGWETSIRSIKERLKPDIESMEGAAFFIAAG